MKLFMSHHSSAKPLVREVARQLPAHIASWIDERELLPGDNLQESLRTAVTSEVDYVVIFLDGGAISSQWVQSELTWAREEEARLGRTFLIPIVLDKAVTLHAPWIEDRLYIRLHGYEETHIRELATELSTALFGLVSRDLSILRSGPQDTSGRLREVDRANELLRELSIKIRTEVFPYRRDRPLLLRDLAAKLEAAGYGVVSVEQLRDLLVRLRERKALAGIGVTASSIYVSEEHLSWRLQEARHEKRRSAEFIVDQIADHSHVYLDAGSSSMEVCHRIVDGLKLGQWQSLSISTIAVPIANVLSELSNELGLEDGDPRLSVRVLGGRMRLNTAALLPPESVFDELNFDVAVVGTNGVTVEYGLTTTMSSEAILKAAAIRSTKCVYVPAEPAKYGVWQPETFATLDMRLTLVTPCTPSNRSHVDEFAAATANTQVRVKTLDLD